MNERIKPTPSNKVLEEAKRFGGADLVDYREETVPYYDKGSHLQRSIFHRKEVKDGRREIRMEI